MDAATEKTTDGEFSYFVDEDKFSIGKPDPTAGELMDGARVPRGTGLILIHDNGVQEQVQPKAVIDLKPGARFKKPPRFKRG